MLINSMLWVPPRQELSDFPTFFPFLCHHRRSPWDTVGPRWAIAGCSRAVRSDAGGKHLNPERIAALEEEIAMRTIRLMQLAGKIKPVG